MEVFLMYFLFVVGLILIIKGGDLFVDAAAWIAEVSGIPHFIVGATIVGFATSLPEILVSVFGAAQRNISGVDLAMGNAIGSVTANTGLILGVSLLFMPMVIKLRDYLPKILILLASIAPLWAFGATSGNFTLVAAIVMTLVFAFFVFENVRTAKQSLAADTPASDVREGVTRAVVAKKIIMFLLGCAGIVGGSELLVNYGTEIAASLGVPTRIISISAVAVGTSLPELVTTISAITKKQASLSVGNILGSNIIDLTFILPPCFLAYGGNMPFSAETVWVDLPVLFALSLISFVPTLFTRKFARWQGVLLLASYVGYMVFTFVTH